MKDNATVITAEEFDKQVLGLDSNFKSHVRAPAEATIDSRALRFLSETALKKSKLFKTDINAFDPDEFVLRFRQVMSAKAPIDNVGNSSEDDEAVAEEIDWCKVGKSLMRFSRRAPTLDLMYGPLEILHKKRKLTQRAKLEKHESERKEPELIDNNDIERSQAEMSALIKRISDLLTSEEFICLSFLIRDGKAAIETHDDDNMERDFLLLSSKKFSPAQWILLFDSDSCEPAGADQIQDGATKNQIILELTMSELVRCYRTLWYRE
ncbi:hypothetical protein H4Q26_015585 [Puccinia striiformis f. sp. tritici PST-130]|nr:hypothetical protein H4Q26_015585 [Puccinia striiformis f. sp. tritici PST-130]